MTGPLFLPSRFNARRRGGTSVSSLCGLLLRRLRIRSLDAEDGDGDRMRWRKHAGDCPPAVLWDQAASDLCLGNHTYVVSAWGACPSEALIAVRDLRCNLPSGWPNTCEGLVRSPSARGPAE